MINYIQTTHQNGNHSVGIWSPNPYLNPYGGLGNRDWEIGVGNPGLGIRGWEIGIGKSGLGNRGWEIEVEGFGGFGDQTPTSIQNVSILFFKCIMS
jgi:hypothetical protein